MAWIHGMHKETKPTAIKKKNNKHVNEKQKWMIILEREKNSFSHGIRTQNINTHMMIIIS